MSTSMPDISEVHNPAYTSTNSSVSSLRTPNNLSTSLDINKSNNRQSVDCTYHLETHSLPDLFKTATNGSSYETSSLSGFMPPTKVDLYKSPNQLVLPFSNNMDLPKLETITLNVDPVLPGPVQVPLPGDPASKWQRPFLKVIPACKLYKLHLALPRPPARRTCSSRPGAYAQKHPRL